MNLKNTAIYNTITIKQSQIRKIDRLSNNWFKKAICFVLILIISLFCLNAMKTYQLPSYGATYVDSKEYERFRDNLPEIQDIQRGNSTGNIANFGLFCMANGWIYYSTDEGLIKTQPDSQEKTVIRTGIRCWFINVVDDQIIFADADTSRIYTIRTDGSKYKRLVDQGCKYVQVIDDAIYYLDLENEGIYKVGLDGKKKHLIVHTNTRFFLVKDGWVYYFSEYISSHGSFFPGGIHKIRTDGSNVSTIVNATIASYYFDIADQFIYYCDFDEGFSRVKTNGSEKEKNINKPSPFFNLFNRWVFACDMGCKLYRMDLNGSNQLFFDNRETGFPHVVGEWIYYSVYWRDSEIEEIEWYRIKMNGTGREKV